MRKERRHALEDRAAAVAQAVATRLPLSACAGIGALLGRLLGALDRRHVGIAVTNMRRAFPEWDDRRRVRTAHRVYAHFGRVLFEILWLRGRSPAELRPLFEVVGREHVDEALAAGRGITFPTAHVGNWEITATAHALTAHPFGVVARELDNPALERRLFEIRTQCGNTVIYKTSALAQMLRILRTNGAVGILVDQNVQERDGIFVDFFGHPANTTTITSALAVKTGCALVPGHTVRLPGGRYRLTYDPPIRVDPSGDRRTDIARLTQKTAKQIETWIRAAPEQWLWMHRRWHTQPAPGQGPHPALAGWEG
jgi:KDO2-lipid IV(A) lauroyltransferase